MKGILTERNEPFVESTIDSLKNKVIGREAAGGWFEKKFYNIVFNKELYFPRMNVTKVDRKW